MVAKFVWFYVRVLLAIAISLGFGALVLAWKYGFQSLLKSDLHSEAIIGLILFPVAALAITIAHFALERLKK